LTEDKPEEEEEEGDEVKEEKLGNDMTNLSG